MKPAIFGVIALLAAVALYWTMRVTEAVGTRAPEAATGSAMVDVVVPEALSENAEIGKVGFDANCTSCHGANAVGRTEIGPPLIHVIYEPSHHGDEAFQRAVALGVRSHHWRFGSMPAVEGLARADVQMIVTYIREIQRANGIN